MSGSSPPRPRQHASQRRCLTSRADPSLPRCALPSHRETGRRSPPRNRRPWPSWLRFSRQAKGRCLRLPAPCDRTFRHLRLPAPCDRTFGHLRLPAPCDRTFRHLRLPAPSSPLLRYPRRFRRWIRFRSSPTGRRLLRRPHEVSLQPHRQFGRRPRPSPRLGLRGPSRHPSLRRPGPGRRRLQRFPRRRSCMLREPSGIPARIGAVRGWRSKASPNPWS